MEQTLPLLFNTVDKIFFGVGIVICLMLCYACCEPKIFVIGTIAVCVVTALYLIFFRDKTSTIYTPWCILVSEVAAFAYYVYAMSYDVEYPLLWTIVATIIAFSIYYGICYFKNVSTESNNKPSKIEIQIEDSKVLEYIEEFYEIIPLCEFSSASNDSENNFVCTGYMEGKRVYIYYYVNEQGLMVEDFVTTNKLYSGFSKTLKKGEQPYLKIIYQYNVTVNNSGVKEERESKHIKTLNEFYVPEDFKILECGLKQ